MSNIKAAKNQVKEVFSSNFIWKVQQWLIS